MSHRWVDPEIEKVGKGEDGEELWLVKVSPKIAEEWMDAPAGANLGILDIITRADGSVVYDATLSANPGRKKARVGEQDVSATVVGLYPVEHTAAFRMTPQIKPVIRPGMTPEQKAKLYEKTAVFEGGITQKFTLKSDRERQDALEAHLKAEEERKFGRVVTEQEVWTLQRHNMDVTAPTFGATIKGGDMKSRKRRRAEDKLTMEALRDHLIECFAKEPHLTLKQINGPINQSEDRVKAALKKHCDYNTGGEFRGKWELKSEYLLQFAEQLAAARERKG
uniref:TFIIF beta subunit HTH domain-containing protein n=1 Tax=Phaeomonas parva TaxID=124430 RepID=A0A7S1TVI9_9STRA|mmetsp:Transcript_19900/g.60264  ORF Transcript_19900/g.60264 Transcript_19900/m.60264 type:complete len:279 (+) Transcript_19900:231-1067(+)|eukprot:CAMPEP_0118884846 /NCGR_PEP_ID=MMETSP1163-20130328/23562_1 /TAXON_ID=124430 /ORGANISM="Phaeomonas parva, Strain CCMP2877" /LENGTH=278 /DNA_ID=CAMNT_0006822751 /DNA_START=230 /DNA_END=1066 /DNA_ORIENTATION=+